ncbi:uroporphyrinogen decarboxylase, partial [Gammaproteobacteria bacterium]|nr:uroporphyrinogen decarboxylase [Gammaproteobacteria bacterium]
MNNSSFLQALNREKNDVPPIWFMRQAGRYLPEYQTIRKNYKNFLDMCKEPRTCAELALQPIERFDLDASILFSDILTIPDAFNLGLAFHEGEGPKFSNPISTPQDIARLEDFQIEKLSYVYK